MTLEVSTATGTVQAVACLPEQSIFIVRNIWNTCVRYFPCLFIPRLHDPANVQQISSKRRTISTCILKTFAGTLLKFAERLLDRVNGVCSCLYHLAR